MAASRCRAGTGPRAGRAWGWASRCRSSAARPCGRALSEALISPASPAAHLVWPIIDLTEPTTHSRWCAPASLEEPAERLDLDDVAQGGAGAVRLDVADRSAAKRRPWRRLARGLASALRPPARSSPGAAVARGAHALDHRVDPVAVALGVGQALEHQRGHAFADDDPVGTRRRTAGSGHGAKTPGSC